MQQLTRIKTKAVTPDEFDRCMAVLMASFRLEVNVEMQETWFGILLKNNVTGEELRHAMLAVIETLARWENNDNLAVTLLQHIRDYRVKQQAAAETAKRRAEDERIRREAQTDPAWREQMRAGMRALTGKIGQTINTEKTA